MTRRWVAALAAGWMLVACGGGGSLPPGPGADSREPPTTNPDGSIDLPGDPVPPDDPGPSGDPEDPPARPASLWPLTAGSTWVYDIKDPVHGDFQKHVTVLGQREVPDTQGKMTATLVHSRQDRLLSGVVYEEYSWQLELTNGLVVRLREEDHKDGNPVRTTTWSPATVKSLARVPESLPWTYQSEVQELTVLGDGSRQNTDPTYNWRVVEQGLTVRTKAGTFTNVIKVQRDKLNDKGEVKADKVRYYWLAPGVGKIREEGERLEELSSYDVKK
ncbi:hypothetical protein [Myxococcus sp. RHSTA-1-4]|uniref:hypothetical protein n=1 Tax=Myxococcus sp. RHSTA-1-4 TaxID=2874601 RepID=UPI001CBBCB9E|nr:hypothetical protein [Myxococcus sp. RHSTA-1-4]MBZ4417034.1 hypothetical protein [Myxococcus sp. RHSTA-1-4]